MNGEHTKPVESRTEDRRNMPDRLWIRQGGYDVFLAAIEKPVTAGAVEYMRVLSRTEVEKLAGGEGVDTQQYINSLLRTIEGQRRHIERLENPSAHVAAGVTGHD